MGPPSKSRRDRSVEDELCWVMRTSLIAVIVFLSVTSVAMRYLSSHVDPEARSGSIKDTLKAVPAERPIFCPWAPTKSAYTNTARYHSKKELNQDIVDKDSWIGYTLFEPVQRNGRPSGFHLRFRPPHPFSRLGLQDGDILIALNRIRPTRMEDLPDILLEMKSASSLHFKIERDGVVLTLNPQLGSVYFHSARNKRHGG